MSLQTPIQVSANIEKAASKASDQLQKAKQGVGAVILGQDKVVDLSMAAILSGGHALLVGVPGLAKTLLVETCLLYTSPSPRDQRGSRMPSSA